MYKMFLTPNLLNFNTSAKKNVFLVFTISVILKKIKVTASHSNKLS